MIYYHTYVQFDILLTFTELYEHLSLNDITAIKRI